MEEAGVLALYLPRRDDLANECLAEPLHEGRLVPEGVEDSRQSARVDPVDGVVFDVGVKVHPARDADRIALEETTRSRVVNPRAHPVETGRLVGDAPFANEAERIRPGLVGPHALSERPIGVAIQDRRVFTEQLRCAAQGVKREVRGHATLVDARQQARTVHVACGLDPLGQQQLTRERIDNVLGALPVVNCGRAVAEDIVFVTPRPCRSGRGNETTLVVVRVQPATSAASELNQIPVCIMDCRVSPNLDVLVGSVDSVALLAAVAHRPQPVSRRVVLVGEVLRRHPRCRGSEGRASQAPGAVVLERPASGGRSHRSAPSERIVGVLELRDRCVAPAQIGQGEQLTGRVVSIRRRRTVPQVFANEPARGVVGVGSKSCVEAVRHSRQASRCVICVVGREPILVGGADAPPALVIGKHERASGWIGHPS